MSTYNLCRPPISRLPGGSRDIPCPGHGHELFSSPEIVCIIYIYIYIYIAGGGRLRETPLSIHTLSTTFYVHTSSTCHSRTIKTRSMHLLFVGSGGVKDGRQRNLPLPPSFSWARPLFERSAAAIDSRNASLDAADRSMV